MASMGEPLLKAFPVSASAAATRSACSPRRTSSDRLLLPARPSQRPRTPAHPSPHHGPSTASSAPCAPPAPAPPAARRGAGTRSAPAPCQHGAEEAAVVHEEQAVVLAGAVETDATSSAPPWRAPPAWRGLRAAPAWQEVVRARARSASPRRRVRRVEDDTGMRESARLSFTRWHSSSPDMGAILRSVSSALGGRRPMASSARAGDSKAAASYPSDRSVSETMARISAESSTTYTGRIDGFMSCSSRAYPPLAREGQEPRPGAKSKARSPPAARSVAERGPDMKTSRATGPGAAGTQSVPATT
jgi:hypothetical protein